MVAECPLECQIGRISSGCHWEKRQQGLAYAVQFGGRAFPAAKPCERVRSPHFEVKHIVSIEREVTVSKSLLRVRQNRRLILPKRAMVGDSAPSLALAHNISPGVVTKRYLRFQMSHESISRALFRLAAEKSPVAAVRWGSVQRFQNSQNLSNTPTGRIGFTSRIREGCSFHKELSPRVEHPPAADARADGQSACRILAQRSFSLYFENVDFNIEFPMRLGTSLSSNAGIQPGVCCNCQDGNILVLCCSCLLE